MNMRELLKFVLKYANTSLNKSEEDFSFVEKPFF